MGRKASSQCCAILLTAQQTAQASNAAGAGLSLTHTRLLFNHSHHHLQAEPVPTVWHQVLVWHISSDGGVPVLIS